MYQPLNQTRDDGDAHSQRKAVFQRGVISRHANQKITAVTCMHNVPYKGTARYSAAFPHASCLWQALCSTEEAGLELQRCTEGVGAAAATSGLAQQLSACLPCVLRIHLYPLPA